MGKTPVTLLAWIGRGLLAAYLLTACAMPRQPDRIQQFAGAIASIPSAWKEEPIVVLADTVAIRMVAGNDGNVVRYNQSTWYYVNHRKPEILEQVIIPDFRSIENIPGIRATAYFPGGESWTVSGLGITRQKYTEEGLYSSDRFVSVFQFPKYLEGMVIHLEVDHVYTRPEFLKSEWLRDTYPAISRIVSLSLPKGAEIKYSLVNPESLQVRSELTESELETQFTVRAEKLAKLESATMPRDPETWLAALHFSLPAKGNHSMTWAELGDNYLASTAASFQATPELEALAAGLNSKDPDTLTRQVYNLLRSRIRYHADLEILHSFIPRPAGEVLAKGYGDCKEMSTLMTELLRLKGVRAGVALISTPGAVQVVEAFPSMGGFNHMIVYTEAADGSIRFFDPTVKQGDPFDSYFELIDRTALVLKPGASALKIVPMGPGYQNRVATKSLIRKGSGASNWSLIGSIRLEGHCAAYLRSLLSVSLGEEKTPLLRAYLKEMFAVDAAECRVAATNDHAVEVTYEASFNSNYLNMDKGGLLLACPSLYGGDVRFSSIQVEGSRYVQQFDQNDTWEVPAGFDDLEKSDLEHVIGKGKWTRKGPIIGRTFGTKVSVVPPEKQASMTDYARLKNRFVKGKLWHR